MHYRKQAVGGQRAQVHPYMCIVGKMILILFDGLHLHLHSSAFKYEISTLGFFVHLLQVVWVGCVCMCICRVGQWWHLIVYTLQLQSVHEHFSCDSPPPILCFALFEFDILFFLSSFARFSSTTVINVILGFL